jgi:hypothetical protein
MGRIMNHRDAENTEEEKGRISLEVYLPHKV